MRFRTYYNAGGRPVAGSEAARTWANVPGVTAQEVQYLHPDHLGSIGQITSQTGAWVQDAYFYPYGGIRWSQSGGNAISPTSATRRTYTGQRDIGFWAGAIMHYNARQYSVTLGRFLQPDTVTADPGNPYDLNRYMYVRGNPTNLNDPTGHVPLLATIAGGAVLGALAGAAVYYFTVPVAQQNATDLWIAAGTGAAAGALIGTGVGISAGAATFAGISAATAGTAGTVATGAGLGMGASQIGYSVGTRITGDRYSSAEMVGSAVIGGIQGGVSAYIPIRVPDQTLSRVAERFALDGINNVGASITQNLYSNYVEDGSLDFDADFGPSMTWSGTVGFLSTIAERAVVAQIGQPFGTIGSALTRNGGLAAWQYWMEDTAEDNRR